jgi:hypothetical protein
MLPSVSVVVTVSKKNQCDSYFVSIIRKLDDFSVNYSKICES